MPSDLRTRAIVLRRTNYGETDRILNLLTPEGKISALAKGVRKEKSRLAGGIELFSVADVVIHQGRSSLGTLTSARMICFYSHILSDLARLEFASESLRKVEKLSEQVDNPDYFNITNQTLAGLNQQLPSELIRAWFTLNLAKASGEEINLYTDVSGEALSPELSYFWDGAESALRADMQGPIQSQHIKLARLLPEKSLVSIAHIDDITRLITPLDPIVRSFA